MAEEAVEKSPVPRIRGRHRLTASLPRRFADHRRYAARKYRETVLAYRQRFPNLGSSADYILAETGLAVLDLQRLRDALELLEAREGKGRRPKETRRLRGEIRKTRVQLLLLERRLEHLASSKRAQRPGSVARRATRGPPARGRARWRLSAPPSSR